MDHLDIGEESKSELKVEFTNLINIIQLNELWLCCSDILSIVNDLYPNNFNTIKHIVYAIYPFVESFFLIYNQTGSDAFVLK